MVWVKLRSVVFLAVVGSGIVVLSFLLLIYRPLPAELCSSTTSDRITIHILEPIARLFYYYPTRLCPTAHCRLHWIRKASAFLYWAIGPKEDNDSHLRMETTHWNGVKVRIYYPRDREKAESDGAIIYESLTRKLAKEMSTRLFVSVDYRLAPETIFPGGLEDCERVLEYMFSNGTAMFGIDSRKIIVMGDSAGGNLAAAIAQRRHASGNMSKILGQALLYPWLQMSDQQTPSFRYWKREMSELAFLDPQILAHFTLWYAGVNVDAHPEFAFAVTENRHIRINSMKNAFRVDRNCTEMAKEGHPNEELTEQLTPFLNNPLFAPLMRSNLSDLPPALVITCEFDILRDEGVIYAQRLKHAGVSTKWVHYQHGFHGMLCIHSKLDVAQQAIGAIKDWTMKLLLHAEAA